MSEMKIYAERRPFGRGIDLSLGVFQRDHKMAVARPLVMETIEEGDIAPPFMTLKQTDAQQLMDELWTCGIRPSEGSGSAGSLAATVRHLEDMRRLVFKEGGAA
jgi:hypothetical protein